MRAAWKKGVDWFPTLDPTWQDVIGAGEVRLEMQGCECIEEDQYGQITYFTTNDGTPCEDIEMNNFPYIQCSPRFIVTSTYQPNDGFILAESAANGPGNTYPVQFMDGSGHMQMKNDSNTADAMNKIFIQGLGSEYFKTNKR